MSLKGTCSFEIPSNEAIGAHAAANGANEDGLMPPVLRKKLTSEALIHGPAEPIPHGNGPADPTERGFDVSVTPEFAVSARARSQFTISASVSTGLALTGRFKWRPRFML